MFIIRTGYLQMQPTAELGRLIEALAISMEAGETEEDADVLA